MEGDLQDVLSYFSQSSNQINMGWTITNWWYVIIFIVGIITVFVSLLLIVTNNGYLDGMTSKRHLTIAGFVGISLAVLGAFGTMYSFTTTVRSINKNIKQLGPCSLFQNINAETAISKVVSDNALEFATNSRISNSIDNLNRKSFVNNRVLAKNELDDASKSFIGNNSLESKTVAEAAKQSLKASEKAKSESARAERESARAERESSRGERESSRGESSRGESESVRGRRNEEGSEELSASAKYADYVKNLTDEDLQDNEQVAKVLNEIYKSERVSTPSKIKLYSTVLKKIKRDPELNNLYETDKFTEVINDLKDEIDIE